MKQLFTMTLMVCCLALSSQSKAQDIVVDLNGMVCDFCARGLEKSFGKIKEIEAVAVSLEQSTLSIDMQEGYTIPDATISKLVEDNGLNAANIRRGTEITNTITQPQAANDVKPAKKKGLFGWFTKD